MTILVVGGLLAVAYRSVRMTFLALSIGAIGTWVVVATMGLLSVPLSLVTLLLPSIMLALGCAYSIHMLSAARGPSNYLGDRLKHVALPVALSSLTTAIGFSAIGTIAIDEVRYVGGFGALGALVLGIATLTVAPALLTLWETKVDFEPPRLVTSRLRPLIVRIATKRARTALVVWLGVLAILAIGIWRVDVVSDPTKWFRPGSEVRDSYESIGMELSGISPVNVVVESDSGDSVTSPAALSAIDGLTTFLEEIPYVGKATSIRDPLRQLHGGFSDDDSYPLPVEPNLAEQYLLLLESVEQISDLVLADRSAANILLRVNDNGSEALLEIERRADQWWAQHGPQGFTARTTGIMYEFARAQNEISYGQLRGLTLAFIAIGITMLLALRSFRLAFLSMVPNVVPTAMVFGVMGWLSMPLDAGTVVIGSLALGIAVDDTIHLVSGFHEGLEAGRSSAEALGEAVDRVLHPVILTTVAIGLGFGLFGFSGFTLTRNVGLLLAGIAVVCLLADLFLLPALLTLASNVRSKS
jgi:predicted RND superfamily exporter protein